MRSATYSMLREVIRLMVNLLFVEDDEVLSQPGVVRTIYDPAAGPGGMLSIAGEYLAELNPEARLTMFGQELNDESYAICKADTLIKGQDVKNIVAVTASHALSASAEHHVPARVEHDPENEIRRRPSSATRRLREESAQLAAQAFCLGRRSASFANPKS